MTYLVFLYGSFSFTGQSRGFIHSFDRLRIQNHLSLRIIAIAYLSIASELMAGK